MLKAFRKAKENKNGKKANTINIAVNLQEKAKGTFLKISGKFKKGIAKPLKKAALISLFTALSYVGVKAETPVYKNYVVPAKGFETELTIVNNDVDNSVPNHSMLYIAYDSQGNVLDEVPDFMATGSRLKINLQELFSNKPEIVNKIAFVEIDSSNRNDVLIRYYREKDGNIQTALVTAPVSGRSEVYDIHFTNNDYWEFISNIGKISSDGSVVTITAYPNGGYAFTLDGSTKINDSFPDLTNIISGVSFNVKDLFGGVVPQDATWFKVTSKSVSNDPFSNPQPSEDIFGNNLFMKANGESGGGFGQLEAFEELYIPHIADDTNNPDPNKRYWWTGLALVNPNDADVSVTIQYYDENGVRLDTNKDLDGVNDYTFVIPARGKVVDLINNFGKPEGAAFARVVASDKIIGGELFGGEPSGANWPIMAGVPLILPGTGGYLASVTDIIPPVLSYQIPLAESRDANGVEEGVWTGLAFLNISRVNQTIVLQYKNSNGKIIGTQDYTIASQSKQAITVKDLLNTAGLNDIREQVAMIDILARDVNNSNPNQNREVLVYALQGGLLQKDGELIHNWMIGEKAIVKSPVDIKLFIRNNTVGMDKLEDILGSMNIKVEDNDEVLSHVIGLLRDTHFGEITGYDIIAVDDEGNEVGHLGGWRDELRTSSYNKYYLNYSEGRIVDSTVCPYGTFKIGIKVYTSINGVEQAWTYMIPDKTITRNPEQDYDIDAIKGDGWSYQKSKSNLEELASLVSSEDVKWQDGKYYSYDENLPYLQNLFDGDTSNFEASYVEIIDTHGGFEDSTAGMLKIWRTDGYPEWFSTSSEKTVEKWKKFYEVGIYNTDSNNK